MKTVYASLPFYDSLIKQDKNRDNAIIPIHCPINQIPPFQINCESATIGTVDEVLLIDCAGSETDITSYFIDLPEVITDVGTANDTYISYNGGILNDLLTPGSYYVKVSGGGYSYYSDYISVYKIYSNLIKSWRSLGTYETFTTSGTSIISAINSAGSGSSLTDATSFSVFKGEVIKSYIYLTLNSGQAPSVWLTDSVVGTISNVVVLTAGLNEITFTCTASGDATFMAIQNSAASNFSTTHIQTQRSYSPNYTKLVFSNTNDLGNILYSTGFEQQVWLESKLNTPTQDVVEVGEEKDGVFYAEKLVTKNTYKIIAYVSRSLYQTLIRLTQHDSITITDEVGNIYTPAVGNVFIDPVEWVTYETGKLQIKFNDGDNSAFTWTQGMTNLI